MKTLVILGLVFLLAFLYSLLGAACYGLVEALFSFFGIHNEFVIAIFYFTFTFMLVVAGGLYVLWIFERRVHDGDSTGEDEDKED